MTIETLIDDWWGKPGGQERSNFAPFITDLCDALDLPRPGRAEAGRLGTYEYEGTVPGGSFRSLKSTGYIDLYKRGHFVMEAKQSLLPPDRQAQLDLEPADAAPRTPSGARYDRLMQGAHAQAEHYAKNLPGDHPPVPFLIVCDIGRAFEIMFDKTGNGRGYGYFPDRQSYRIELPDLRNPDIADRLRAIWTEPHRINPRFQSAEVTGGIARRLAQVSQYLEESNRARARAEGPATESAMIEETSLFLMRIIFCMFAEDIDLLPKGRFRAFLEGSIEDQVRFENGLHDLWSKMNSRGGGFAWAVEGIVRYFNGGLFDSQRTYVLSNADRGELYQAARADWKKVEPAIFGTLLEQALTKAERAKLGAHYTPRPYVERLVQATIMDVLDAEWAAIIDPPPEGEGGVAASSDVPGAHYSSGAGSRSEPSATPNGGGGSPRSISPVLAAAPDTPLTAAQSFHDRLATLVILDPACGTGNFLYVAMESLQNLESKVIEHIQQLGGTASPRVGPHQFHGLELNPRAAKIAELVLWIGWLRFRITNNPDAVTDPVLTNSENINFGRPGGFDAVLAMTDTGQPDLDTPRTPDWPAADFIIGNPPFIGGKDLRERLGGDYAQAMWAANPRVPPSADFVMQWWDHAAHLLTQPGARLKRFGFVTTNSITQEFSRRVIQRYLNSSPSSLGEGGVAASSDVPGAHRSSGAGSRSVPSNEAVEGSPAGRSNPIPPTTPDAAQPRTLSLIFAIPDHPWTKASKDSAAVRIAMTVAQAGEHHGHYVEVVREEQLDSDTPSLTIATTDAVIHANLAIGADVASARPLLSNEGIASRGVSLHGNGFLVTPSEAQQLGLGRREGLEAHIRPYLNGRDLLQRSRGLMVIDLFGLAEVEVRQRFPEVYERLLLLVKPDRDKNRRVTRRENWWLFGELAPAFRSYSLGLNRYIATVETSKHRVFQFLDSSILPDNMLVAFGSDQAFDLGVVQSTIHTDWALRGGGWLGVGNDSRYSKSKVFDPFPFPDPTPDQRTAIADLAEELDATRKLAIAETPGLTMTELYNLRDRVRTGADMPPADRARATAARAGIVHRLHEQLDAAVAAAYGWGDEWAVAPLPPSEIVTRLVALNAARAAEEAAGHVRWLRPDYQRPRFEKPA